MINLVRGNLFENDAEALVNTVNCVGVMGKGIAYQFKRAFPEMFKDYKRRCSRGQIRLGEVTTFRERGKLIINFPTKGHWRAKSKLEDVEAGLTALRKLIEQDGLSSVALPPLGCGNGGLDWAHVRAAIERTLSALEGVRVDVYEPVGRFVSKVARKPKLSLSSYVLAALRLRLARPTKLNLQKALYFFNVLVEPGYFDFKRHKYGPYAIAMDPMVRAVRDYLEFMGISVEELVERGLRDELSGRDADRLRRWMAGIEVVAAFCNRHETMLEALATAHAVVESDGPLSVAQATERFLAWSPEKAKKYNEGQATAALRVLEEEGLVRQTLFGFETGEPRVLSAAAT